MLTIQTLKNYNKNEKDMLIRFFDIKRFSKKIQPLSYIDEITFLDFKKKMEIYSIEDLEILNFFALYEFYSNVYIHLNIIQSSILANNYKMLNWLISQGEVLDHKCIKVALSKNDSHMVEYILSKFEL